MTLNETTRKELDLRLDAIEEDFNSNRREDRTMATITFAYLLDEIRPEIESFAFLDEEKKLRTREPNQEYLRVNKVVLLSPYPSARFFFSDAIVTERNNHVHHHHHHSRSDRRYRGQHHRRPRLQGSG